MATTGEGANPAPRRAGLARPDVPSAPAPRRAGLARPDVPSAPAPRRAGLARPDVLSAPAPAPASASQTTSVPADAPASPLPLVRTVFPGRAALRWNEERAHRRGVPHEEPERHGRFTKRQWSGIVCVGGAGLVVVAVMVVLFVRWFVSLAFMQDFLQTYPGVYPLPVIAPVGFPAWLNWQHAFNVFFMVLIIRTGLTVRREKRPSVFWSPRRGDRKISLTLWLHQSLDILWLVNGVIFAVLLFASGQWMRIVPTSWSVFPNAISAALQYASLNWPTEDGWANYNSLQQLAYFAIVFLAAPLAVLTGIRMSGIWPKSAKRLNRAYPIEWARAVHFPVMLAFVAFVIVHVTLVFATGALRNLNHMYAASDRADGTGLWVFALSVVVIAAAWIAARPLVLAPIARLFGRVSGR